LSLPLAANRLSICYHLDAVKAIQNKASVSVQK